MQGLVTAHGDLVTADSPETMRATGLWSARIVKRTGEAGDVEQP